MAVAGGDTSGIQLGTAATNGSATDISWQAQNRGLAVDSTRIHQDLHVASVAFVPNGSASGFGFDTYAVAGNGATDQASLLQLSNSSSSASWNQVAPGTSGSPAFSVDGTNGSGNGVTSGSKDKWNNDRPTGHLFAYPSGSGAASSLYVAVQEGRLTHQLAFREPGLNAVEQFAPKHRPRHGVPRRPHRHCHELRQLQLCLRRDRGVDRRH